MNTSEFKIWIPHHSPPPWKIDITFIKNKHFYIEKWNITSLLPHDGTFATDFSFSTVLRRRSVDKNIPWIIYWCFAYFHFSVLIENNKSKVIYLKNLFYKHTIVIFEISPNFLTAIHVFFRKTPVRIHQSGVGNKPDCKNSTACLLLSSSK